MFHDISMSHRYLCSSGEIRKRRIELVLVPREKIHKILIQKKLIENDYKR